MVLYSALPSHHDSKQGWRWVHCGVRPTSTAVGTSASTATTTVSDVRVADPGIPVSLYPVDTVDATRAVVDTLAAVVGSATVAGDGGGTCSTGVVMRHDVVTEKIHRSSLHSVTGHGDGTQRHARRNDRLDLAVHDVGCAQLTRAHITTHAGAYGINRAHMRTMCAIQQPHKVLIVHDDAIRRCSADVCRVHLANDRGH